jgi:type I restriction enzyme S subunit
MYGTTVSGSKLELRIDPAFYHPSHLMDVDSIMRFPVERLDALRDNSARMSYGILKPRFEDNSPYRMVRIQDFRDPFLDVDSAVAINQSQFAEFHRSECKAGDILIAIAGYVGRAAIVPECLLKLNINQHIARFRPSSTYNIDPYYLISYLISSIGRRQLCRYVSGSVQTGINLEDLRELLIPQPDQLVQKYIGDKVRQAERLHQLSQQLYSKLSPLVELPAIQLALETPNSKSERLPIGEVTPRLRLDPKHYDSRAMAVLKACRKMRGVTIGSLGPEVTNGFEHRAFVNEGGVPYITVSEVSGGRLDVEHAPRIAPNVRIPAKGLTVANCVLVVRGG